jgi:two-component system CheB/CheR fusion protein
MRLAQDAAGIGVFDRDLDTGVNTWTPELVAMHGLPPGGFSHTVAEWERLVHPEDREGALRLVRHALETGLPVEGEWRVVWPDGSVHWVLARFQAVREAGGRPLRLTGVNIDITARKVAEEAMRESERRKDEFLAVLAHELRNPLAPVRNAVQVLHMKGPSTPEVQWAKTIIDRQMQAMTRLIEDLMDVSRISRGKIELRREPLDLARVIQDAVDSSRPIIEQHGHELTVSLPTEAVSLAGDPTRLTQVFLNLLNNAAKFTERGGRISLAAEAADGGVTVTVRDTGLGIPAANLSTIFDMFSQVESTMSRSRGGLGIGLCLVKRIVELHGGRVEASSPGLNQGSEFRVRLPTAGPGPVARSSGVDDQDQPTPSSRLRILVADDNEDAATSLKVLLGAMGNTVYVAHDGQEAVDLADRHRPEVVLLDIGMPKMNGYEAARAIREKPWGRHTILIAVTGWGQEEDKRKSREAGFDRHLVKPVAPLALMQLLAETRQNKP